MIDNLTIVKECKPPKELLNASGMPFEYKGLMFNPKYRNGQLYGYDTQKGNLRIYWDLNKVTVSNSIHKYWHGTNHTDFHLNDFKEAITSLSDVTGVDWKLSIVRNIEYGCNIETNTSKVYRSLISYKGKDYLPMHHKGKVYGTTCTFTDYRIKGYDKAFQIKQLYNINLVYPLLRWEVVAHRIRYIESKLKIPNVQVNYLLKPKTWDFLAKDAVSKYQNSIKRNQLQLNDLSIHEKRIVAEMLVPEIRDDLKRHNKETFKRDKAIFSHIKGLLFNPEEDISEKIKDKFESLIDPGVIREKVRYPTCNIVGKRGNLIHSIDRQISPNNKVNSEHSLEI